jgi:shikimate dehydrogenase
LDVSQDPAYVDDWRQAPAADFAVLGDPVARSWSPRLHHAAYRALGLARTYLAIRVPSGELAGALWRLGALGYTGVNCTAPLKEEAFASAGQADQAASRLRAANTLHVPSRSAVNTDAPGFADTLRPLEIEPGGTAVVLGAGGSARAVASVLDELGMAIRVYNRTRERAVAMLCDLGIRGEVMDSPSLDGAALVVDATSPAAGNEANELDWGQVAPGCVAYSLTYAHTSPPFLQRARDRGVRTLDGRHMLVAQAARSLESWLGVEAPRRAMLEAIP